MINKLAMGAFLACCMAAASVHAQTASWIDSAASYLPRGSLGIPNTIPTSNSLGNYSAYPIPNDQRDWKLGVGIDNRDIGAVVTAVAPGSAAQRAGIQVNDVIVAAGPTRLGAFDYRIVELADELKRHADSFGNINLVILDSRSRALRSSQVNLMSTTNSLVTNVALRDRQSLPNGSVLTVQVRNVTNSISEILGGSRQQSVQGPGPFQIELNLDPRYIPQNDQYELYAYVTYNQQTLYQLATPIRLNAAQLSQPQGINLDRGQSVSALYPNAGQSQQQIQEAFQRYLSRQPSSAELLGWQSYLSSGYAISDLRVRLLASTEYRDRFRGNDSQYLQTVFRELVGRNPSNQELSQVIAMLQTSGMPEVVARDMLQKYR